MLDISRGLEVLLSPVSRELFLGEYWDVKPLLIERNTPGFYDGLFSTQELDQLISFSEISFPKIRAVQKDKSDQSLELMRNTFYPDGGLVAQINTAYKLYSEGCTLIMERLEWRSPVVRMLCRLLEADLNHRVGMNAYATPRGSQGFNVHFDDHDVLILQVEGAKHWEIYTPDYALPMDHSPPHKVLSDPERQKPYMSIELAAGDLLYLPRGWSHAARAADCASLHLTVGIHVFRWADLLQEALAQVSGNDVRFRQALPPGFLDAGAPSEALQAHFEELLGALHSQAKVGVAQSEIARRFLLRSEPTTEGRLAELNTSSEITLDTELEKPMGMRCRVVENGQSCTIEFHGMQLKVPAKTASALQFVSQQEGVFKGRNVPGPLREAETLVVLRRLVKEGLLRRATSKASAAVGGGGDA